MPAEQFTLAVNLLRGFYGLAIWWTIRHDCSQHVVCGQIILTGRDKDWQGCDFQLKMYMTVMSSTMAHDINSLGFCDDNYEMNSRLLFQVLVNNCNEATGMILQRIFGQNSLTVVPEAQE